MTTEGTLHGTFDRSKTIVSVRECAMRASHASNVKGSTLHSDFAVFNIDSSLND